MTERWLRIYDFPEYAISTLGRVRNENTDRILALTINQQGIMQVGLTRDYKQFKRSVALLVAKHFLPPPNPTSFDTPIHLDGDRANCEVENLVWRPRWFAIKYHQQFENGERGFEVPIEDVATGEKFETSWDAATKFGLIDKEILVATLNRTYVWPTYQRFRVII